MLNIHLRLMLAVLLALTTVSFEANAAALPVLKDGVASGSSVPSRAHLEHEGGRLLHEHEAREATNDVLSQRTQAKVNKLSAARILAAAAAAVTPGYGAKGHMARRDMRDIMLESRGQSSNFPKVAKLKSSRNQRRKDAAIVVNRAQTAPGVGSSDFPTVGLVSSAQQTTAKPTSSASVSLSSIHTSSLSQPFLLATSASSASSVSSKRAASCTRKSYSSTSKQTSTSTLTSTIVSTTTKTNAASSTSTHTSMTTLTSTIVTTATTTTPTATATATSSYSTKEAMADLNKIMSWAGASDAMTSDQKNETVAALLSASKRYFPEIEVSKVVRYLLADINAESSFNATAWNGGRLDSGESIGLLQVSPGNGSQELPLWMGHSRVSYNNYSWASSPGPMGVLIDYQTGEQMVLSSLTKSDLLRPWLNIHLGAWAQSNLARTASCDPWYWEEISQKAYAARVAETSYAAAASDSARSSAQSAMSAAQSAETASLVCAKLPRSVLTGLGSWVAGAATNGDSSYSGSGDDASASYFANIVKGLKVLLDDSSITTSWLSNMTLTAGLVDYR